jgi:predicted ATP-grasp superfamily ATP-dependent carboligase
MKKTSSKFIAVVVSEKPYSVNAIGAIRSLARESLKTIWLTPSKSGWYPSKYCESITCPNFDSDENRFIQFLISLREEENPAEAVLIPTSDASLRVISKHKDLLTEYFRPLACDWETTRKITEKNVSYQIAEKLGIAIPKTCFPNTKDDLRQISQTINYPCLLKPVISHVFSNKFNQKLFRANTATELMHTYQWLTLMGFNVMVQEDVPGEDANLVCINTVFNKKSEPLAFFMHRRLVQNPPRYGVMALGESIWEPKIIQPCLTLLKSIGFQGLAQVEFKWDNRAKEYKFLEINGRSYLSISFPTRCGLNLIDLACRNAVDEEIAPLTSFSCKYKCGVIWVAFPMYIKSMMQYSRMKEQKLKRLIRPLFTRHLSFSVFSLQDSAPFLTEIVSLTRDFKRIIQIAAEKPSLSSCSVTQNQRATAH